MSKKQDEKTKLLANGVNATAGSCFTVGVIAPAVAVFINFAEAAAAVPLWKVLSCVIFWLTCAVVLHLVARKVFDGLSE